MRRRSLINDGWQFAKAPLGGSLEDVTGWADVEVPHDWLIYNTDDLYETGEGWYRKSFSVASFSGSKVTVRFEGVYMDCTVYVNQCVVGEWKYGYSTFDCDLTPHLRQGVNEMVVRVVHQSPNSRWYTGAGIYRNVWLVTTGLCHIAADGVYIVPRKGEDGWTLEVDTELVVEEGFVWESRDESKDSAMRQKAVRVRQTVVDEGGGITRRVEDKYTISEPHSTIRQRMTVDDPALWDVEAPRLYQLETEVWEEDGSGRVLDRVTQPFGFRTIRFDPNEGFFLNGRHLKLQGVCQHHDLGCLGAVMNKTALRRQFALLREMGANAIRTAHNMPSVECMELADEMGILIVSESFDMWERKKTEYDYARFFAEWHERDVASWVRRDRNHPSLIMWSIGNEVYDTHAGVRGKEVAIRLRDLVTSHDPKGNAAVTFGSNYLPWANTQDCAKEIPIVGYNYAEYLYGEHHKKYPDWIIYGSETDSTVQSRGVYHFPYAQSVLADEDWQCSSLGNSATSWGAKCTERCITDDRDAPYSLGQFIWTGTDYIGEPTPYHAKSSYLGQIDTAGFPKDSFYLFQAEWTDYRKKPMVHILPYWDFNEGQMIDVRVFSNAPKVELFLNDRSLGAYDIDHEKGLVLSGDWRIAYEPGVLKALAYDGEGRVVAEDERRSFGDATRIALDVDKTTMKADGRDLAFLTISMEDAEGRGVENANNRVFVDVRGNGRLMGLDNGDGADFESYKGRTRRLFGGKLLAVIASKDGEGDVEVVVSSVGMEDGTITLQTTPRPKEEGASANLSGLAKCAAQGWTENEGAEVMGERNEVPIRKVALVNHGPRTLGASDEGKASLHPARKCTRVTATIYPPNATYRELEWKLTNQAGIDTNIAELTVMEDATTKGNEITITGKGDGAFRLRCFVRNGKKHVDVISELEFEVVGLGEAYLNPYQFIAGGLYNASNVQLGNGNDRGVATLRDGVSHVGFRGLDFGDYGSNEITMPIFHMSNDLLHFEIWEGMPDEEGSEMLLRAEYDHPSIWNAYQEETFRLPKRLRGVTTLCFVFDLKVHVKGFRFARLNKAYETLWAAADHSGISGDAYQVKEDAVEGIGNNVTITFDHMNFDRGVGKVEICGRTHNETDTIHMRFQKKGVAQEENAPLTESNQIVEFPHTDGVVVKEFPLESVEGECDAAIVFLPGSHFDLSWLRFSPCYE